MQKKKGFSLLELLVVTGIVALLAGISVPHFSKMRSEANFKTEVATIFDQLLEVRMNALTGKMCDGISSDKWIFTFGDTTSEIACLPEGSTEIVPINTLDTFWHQSHSIEIDDVAIIGSASIEFLPDTAQALIPNGASQGRYVKIQITHSSGAEKTICFDRIKGIPEISDGNADCTP